ncbi:hypothetical protein [Pragia fontium]|uniref:Uncharacterized protein n=1 Tax=Pragia fontium DSM 5563 = ATCC 49100 TaxID=1122977 RepID=A0AAJ4W9I5_9GAMM|nr:hypothetical protein [Pragia fontium]SFC49151.1 hypothetical protein SAMN02745723_102497 [Pragia fontium DSM 5563 = ATCC 49100]
MKEPCLLVGGTRAGMIIYLDYYLPIINFTPLKSSVDARPYTDDPELPFKTVPLENYNYHSTYFRSGLAELRVYSHGYVTRADIDHYLRESKYFN